jgi:hypothetical protein
MTMQTDQGVINPGSADQLGLDDDDNVQDNSGRCLPMKDGVNVTPPIILQDILSNCPAVAPVA